MKHLFIFVLGFLTYSLQAATIIVTSENETGPGSITEAIDLAENGDIITALDTLNIVFYYIEINKDVIIEGLFKFEGALIIESGHIVTIQNIISASNITVSENATVTVDNVLLDGTEGLYFGDYGILNSGNCTVKNSTIRNYLNTGILGDGLQSNIILNIENCDIYNNGALGIEVDGVTNITNSLIHHNGLEYYYYSPRGGIVNYGALTITNSVVTKNFSYVVGGINNYFIPSPIVDTPTLVINNCIVTENESFDYYYYVGDIFDQFADSDPQVSGSNNIIGNFMTSGLIEGVNGNLSTDPFFVDCTDNPLVHDLSLLPGSPAIDMGTIDTTGLHLPETDLAGNLRVWNDRIDIGAYEFGSEPPVDPCGPVEENDFETNMGLWNSAGPDVNLVNSPLSNTGSQSVELVGESKAGYMYTDPIDLAEEDAIFLSFNFMTDGFQNERSQIFLFKSDSGWEGKELVKSYRIKYDFRDGRRYFEGINIDGPFTDQTQFYISNGSQGNNERMYVDDIHINPYCDTDNTEPLSRSTENSMPFNLNIELFPNPSNGVFQVTTNEEYHSIFDFQIQNIQGKVIKSWSEPLAPHSIKKFNFQGLADGFYFLNIDANGEQMVKKFQVIK